MLGPLRNSKLSYHLLVTVLVAFGALVAPSLAVAAPPAYKGSSADGEFIFFESEEQLVPGDTDGKRDVYVRSFDPSVGEGGAYVTREVSLGPTGGNDFYPSFFEGASGDGQKVFFSTEEPLVAADKDRKADVYVREAGGTTKLVSGGASTCSPQCGNGAFDAAFAGAGATGNAVLLVTAERLDPVADTDESIDVYARDVATATTSLVSAGGEDCAPGCGNGPHIATLRGLAGNGARAYFATAESLTEADGDEAIDIYARNLPSGPTSLVSGGDPDCAPCGSNGAAAIYAGSSADGSRVFIATSEALVPEDLDGANDIYLRHEGETILLSAGVENKPASFADASADGTRVFFTTAEPLVGADENGANDVYVSTGGPPQLLTSGKCCGSTFGAITPDGETLVFTTTEQLAVGDVDSSADVYSQQLSGGSPVLLSNGDAACAPCGEGPASARFNRLSADGERVFFTSNEKLTLFDFDLDDDIYARDLSDSAPVLWTPPPGLCPVANCNAILVDASVDGLHMVFQTEERLIAEDEDKEADVYERAFDEDAGTEVTRLVSTGNEEGLDLGPEPPVLTGTSPGSPGETTEPSILGEAEDGSLVKIYPTSNCSGVTVASGTAEELKSEGIQVEVPAGTSMTFWATAEADGFTSLCSNPISYTQQAPEGPGEGEVGGGGSGSSSVGSEQPSKKKNAGIEFVAPLTKITFGPASKTRNRRPVFRFGDTTQQPGTRFSCRVDRRRWSSCGSPLKLKRLSLGKHVFRVKGVNALGVWDQRPATRSFKVVAR